MTSAIPPNIMSAVPVTTPEDAPVDLYKFDLPNVTPTVQVKFARDLDKKFSRDELLNYRPFKEWLVNLKASLALQTRTDIQPLHAFHQNPYNLREIHIQSVDYFGKRIGFLKYKAIIKNSDTTSELPGVIFMRGGSVAMLMILRPNDSPDERWVIMTQQPRIPAGSLSFMEIPAGMIDDAGTITGAAVKEIEEETKMNIQEFELIDMTKLALEDSPNPENLKAAMYPTPGGSDEFIALMLWEKQMERMEIEALKNKLTGVKKSGEWIRLDVIRYEDLWKLATRDAKTMVAWALYESLKRAGKLDENGKLQPPSTGNFRR